MRKIKVLDNLWFKTAAVFLITAISLGYLFHVRGLVYTSDLTGAEAELLVLKEEKFGTKTRVYIDRMDVPLARFYSDSPFTIIDFKADSYDRVPVVTYTQPTILLTKKGRFSEKMVGKDYPPVVVEERGDWVLWYFISQMEYEESLPTQ